VSGTALPAARSETPRPLVAVSCNQCGADDFEVVTTVDADYEYSGVIDEAWARRAFRFVRCRRCGLIYQNPRPDAEEIFRYYPAEYGCFAQCPPPGRFMAFLYRIMVWLKKREILPLLPENGVLLDFGCGNGHWLRALQAAGKPSQRFVGVDFCEAQVQLLRAAGIEAHVGTEADLPKLFAPESVDLILFNHVIEHVPDPKATLRTLATLLRPGGKIRGVTPNIDTWDRRLFGKYWAGWHPPRHFVLFDVPMLARYAESAGLSLTESGSEFEGANHWSVSAHTWITEHGIRQRPGAYRLALYPLLLAAAIPITIVQLLLSRTSVSSFVLRKPSPEEGRVIGSAARPSNA
jgi:SAM-dependent methyltransferase